MATVLESLRQEHRTFRRYLDLFETMIGYMNMGYGPEDAAREDPLGAHRSQYGDATEFVYGAYRSMLIAYVPE